VTAAGILVWGEVLWDLFPDGAQLGGAPANVAWHLAMMGAGPALASRVGDDARGHEARARLAARGVDVAPVGLDAERATGEVEVAVAGGEPRYRLVPGRAWERIALDGATRAALAGAGAVVFGTLAQRTDDGFAAWRQMIDAAPPACLRVCDPNLRPGVVDPRALDAALAAADVVKLNDAERRALADRAGADPVAALLGRGARLVAVTHGARGATFHTAGGEHAVAATAAAPGGDNVGCGDAFVAALVLGLVAGWPLARTGALASRWAAAVAEHRGATPDFPAARISAMLGAP
jgi:fructokinase